MTPEEIRDITEDTFPNNDVNFVVQREMCAQLAELNDILCRIAPLNIVQVSQPMSKIQNENLIEHGVNGDRTGWPLEHLKQIGATKL